MSFVEERGRQPGHVVSTGRGGAGNLVSHVATDVDMTPGVERGRELSPQALGDHVTHSGRGGVGNIRHSSHSRTRDELKADAKEEALQEKLISDARGRQADGPISTGRGGVGNISRSRSRSQARTEGGREGSALGLGRRTTHEMTHGGRGGFGNILEERDSVDAEKQAAHDAYEADVLAKHNTAEATHPHAYATGKGGLGNVHTPAPGEPDLGQLSLEEREEKEAHAKIHAGEKDHWVPAGRGGAGNMYRARSDQSPAGDERGRDAHKGGVLGTVLRSISRATGREKSSDQARD
nr:cytoplasmic protein [Cryptococcus depauperatus CBS 7855]